jgi:hypothetical protein
MSAPVISGGRFLGVVSALIDLQSVWDAVMAGHTKEPHALFAVDAKGRLFAAKNLTGIDPGRDMADSEIVKRFRDHPGRATETMPFGWAPRRTDPPSVISDRTRSLEGWRLVQPRSANSTSPCRR